MNEQSMREAKTRDGGNGKGEKMEVVETKEYRSSAGKEMEEREVEVVHLSHPNPNTSGGVLLGAAAAVASTLRSAKEAISKN